MIRYTLIALLSVAAAYADITYPVDVETGRFTFIEGDITRRNVKWPRADGMPLVNISTNLVILQQSVAPLPAFDPSTHKLTPGVWVDDAESQTAVWTHFATPLSQAELDAVAAAEVRATKRVNLSAAITTLRTWADDAEAVTVTSGNAVQTLQVVVDRLGIFFDNFADLLEVQQIGE